MAKIIQFPDRKERQTVRREKKIQIRQQRTHKAGLWVVRAAVWLCFAVRLIVASLAEKAAEIALIILHVLRIPLFLLGGVYCFINYHQNDSHWLTPTDKSTVIIAALIVVGIFSEMLLDMIRHVRPFHQVLFVTEKARPQEVQESSNDQNYR